MDASQLSTSPRSCALTPVKVSSIGQRLAADCRSHNGTDDRSDERYGDEGRTQLSAAQQPRYRPRRLARVASLIVDAHPEPPKSL